MPNPSAAASVEMKPAPSPASGSTIAGPSSLAARALSRACASSSRRRVERPPSSAMKSEPKSFVRSAAARSTPREIACCSTRRPRMRRASSASGSRAARRGRISRCGRCTTGQGRCAPGRRNRRGTRSGPAMSGPGWRSGSGRAQPSGSARRRRRKNRRSSTWSMQNTSAARSTVHISLPRLSMISNARPSPVLGSRAATDACVSSLRGRP